jgi:gamma-glutamyl:cysteine ligase YbdK (ATP-grasp superfamily)
MSDFHESFKGKSLVENYNRLEAARSQRLDESGLFFGSGFESPNSKQVNETIADGYNKIMTIADQLGAEETLDALLRKLDDEVVMRAADQIMTDYEMGQDGMY